MNYRSCIDVREFDERLGSAETGGISTNGSLAWAHHVGQPNYWDRNVTCAASSRQFRVSNKTRDSCRSLESVGQSATGSARLV